MDLLSFIQPLGDWIGANPLAAVVVAAAVPVLLTLVAELLPRREAPRVEGALFYHARRIKPRWARKKKPIARIGRHVFY